MPRIKKNAAPIKKQLNVLVSEETREIFHRIKESANLKSVAEAVEYSAKILDAIDQVARSHKS
jgi:hypothetical protein